MKPLRRIVLALVLLAFWAPMLTAQNLKGKVTDENTRQPLAFVNVVVNDGLTGTMTDIDGKYEITTTEPIQKLKFSCIGYETKVVDILPDATKQKREDEIIQNYEKKKKTDTFVRGGKIINTFRRIFRRNSTQDYGRGK